MTDSLGEAIARKLERRQQQHAEQTFTPDPDLEQWGLKLDALRETDPAQYNHAGLDRIRSQVATYRARQANHKETTR